MYFINKRFPPIQNTEFHNGTFRVRAYMMRKQSKMKWLSQKYHMRGQNKLDHIHNAESARTHLNEEFFQAIVLPF